MRSPTGSAFAAAALAILDAAEAEDPPAVLSPLVAVAPVVGVELVPPVAVAVAAGPLHTIDLGILGKVDATDVGPEKESRDTLAAEGTDRGVYVPVSGDAVNWGAVLM